MKPRLKLGEIPDWSSDMYMKDMQKNDLYTAERDAFRGVYVDNLTLDESVNLMKRLLKSSVVKQAFRQANRPVAELPKVLFDNRGNPWGNKFRVHLTPKFNLLWVVVHEFVHFVRSNITYKEAFHGREFCRLYLDLMYWIDADKGKLLRDEFIKRGVKYRNRPNLSAAERQRRKNRFVQNVLTKPQAYVVSAKAATKELS